VLQTGGLLKDLTVAETVAIVASVSTSPRPVTEVLDRAGIADIAGRRVGKCSGGQQQRLRFAMSLVSDPLLVILDEPTTGMDVEAGVISGQRSGPTPNSAGPSCSPPTTSKRPTPTPTASC